MKAESEELLSLLVDGEQVDPDALAAALAEPDATETLVQYARVHRAVLNPETRPSDQFYQKMRRQLEAGPRRTIPWRAALAAAAVIVLSVLGGMWFGWSMQPARTVSVPVAVRTPSAPPPIADTAAPFRIIVPANCPAPGPPKPDRIVEFVPGDILRPSGAPAGGNRP